jgi:hypothetical protein
MKASIHTKLHKIIEDDIGDAIEKIHKCMYILTEAKKQDIMYMHNNQQSVQMYMNSHQVTSGHMPSVFIYFSSYPFLGGGGC